MKLVLVLATIAIPRFLTTDIAYTIVNGILLVIRDVVTVAKGKTFLLPRRFLEKLLLSILIKISKNNPSLFTTFIFFEFTIRRISTLKFSAII